MYNLPNPFPANYSPNKFFKPDYSKFKAAKAGKNGSLIVLILDESGSMGPYQDDTIGGVNTLLKDQRKDKIATKLVLVTFEGGNVKTVIDGVDVKKVKNITADQYTPSGMTNLIDAVGSTIIKVNSFLKGKKKEERPSVILQIMTDGLENASRKYSKPQIKEMIEKVTKSNWLVTFVGANIDTIAEGQSLGIHSSASVNYNVGATRSAYEVTSSSILRAKSSLACGQSVNALHDTGGLWSDADKKKMKGE